MSLSAVCPGKLSRDLSLNSYPKDLRSPGLKTQPLVYKVSSFTTIPQGLLLYGDDSMMLSAYLFLAVIYETIFWLKNFKTRGIQLANTRCWLINSN